MITASIASPFAVLLISGDPAFTAVMQILIDAEPDHSLTVCDLAAAPGLLQTQDPTLILVDVDSLPSAEAAVALMVLCADVPVAAISAARQLSVADATALYKAGAMSVLFKSGGTSGLGLLRDEQLLQRLHTIAAAADDIKENAA
jgi:DNA-binding NarL/FixJ family response regulator